MRNRLLSMLFFGCAVTLTLSLIRGQERVPVPPVRPALPGVPPATPAATATRLKPLRDLSNLTNLQQQMLLAGQRGADWLFRMNGAKGRFLPGYSPALKQVIEGDSFYRQAGAAQALAYAARFCGEERHAVRATQAILALLEDTAPDSADNRLRHPLLPGNPIDRLGAAAGLVLAICELPAPQKDLLDRCDELCLWISRQAREDGSLACGTDVNSGGEGNEPIPGLALYALLRSHKHRPAPWKLDLARKALPYYRARWQKEQRLETASTQCAAFAEAFVLTREKPFGEFVAEMGDWLVTLQYNQIDPRRMLWHGGFMTAQNGRGVETLPTMASAGSIEALVHACRVAREKGDLTRFQQASEAVERGLQFLVTLQYTDSVTQHYAAWFRPQILGAFHTSHQDGNLRIDHTQHAVVALLGYLEHVAR